MPLVPLICWLWVVCSYFFVFLFLCAKGCSFLCHEGPRTFWLFLHHHKTPWSGPTVATVYPQRSAALPTLQRSGVMVATRHSTPNFNRLELIWNRSVNNTPSLTFQTRNLFGWVVKMYCSIFKQAWTNGLLPAMLAVTGRFLTSLHRHPFWLMPQTKIGRFWSATLRTNLTISRRGGM